MIPSTAAKVLVPAQTRSLGQSAATGFFWLGMQAVALKVAGLVGQIALARLLIPEDFGLVGMAYTVAAFVGLVQQAGIRDVLVQRQAHFNRWANPAFWMSAIIGVLAGALLAASAPLAARLYGQPQLVSLILVMSLGAPTAALTVVASAKLEIQLRFKFLAASGFTLTSTQILLSVLFAWLDWGAMSFVAPVPFLNAVRALVHIWAARPPIRWRWDVRRWRFMIGDSSLLLAANLFVVLIWQGDYMILGRTHGPEAVGIYYFAFNLSLQTILLLTGNLGTVLLPTLSQLQGNASRQLAAYLRAARILAMVGIPACLLQAAVAAPAIELLCGAKWKASVPVLQILSIGMAVRLVEWSSESMLKAQGRFRTFLVLSASHAAVLLASVWAATLVGGPVAVAIAVTICLIAFGVLRVHAGIAPAGGRWRDVGVIFGGPIIASAIAIGSGLLASSLLLPREHATIWELGIVTAVTVIVYLPCARFLTPNTWQELLTQCRVTVLARLARKPEQLLSPRRTTI